MINLDPSLKALEILEACKEHGKEGLGVTEITNMTGLSRSTVHRLATAMERYGYLRKVSSGKKYALGFRLLNLAAYLLDDLEIKEIARPYLQQLSAKSGETVHLVQLDGMYATYVDKIDSPQPVGLLSKVGARLMLHCSGAGKVLLAYMSEEERQHVYGKVGLPEQTPMTITSPDLLEAELQKIREQGYAYDNMENRDGIYCIAGPIFGHRGQIEASFSVSGPAYRFTPEHLTKLQDDVIETTRLISEKLGYQSG